MDECKSDTKLAIIAVIIITTIAVVLGKMTISMNQHNANDYINTK